jgi:thiamine-monophosphate kinase
MTVGETGERSLIQRIRQRTGPSAPGITVGIGDDAAVLEPARGKHDVLTTDSLVEGVHFRLDWTGAHSIGRKAVLVNLSDLAAMGAAPRVLLLSLCLPPALRLSDFDALIDGVLAEATASRTALIGGNITSSPRPLVVTVTAAGSIHPRRVLRRSGARPGDELYLTGMIGGAAAGLEVLESGANREDRTPGQAACVECYEIPPRRVACGRSVAGHRAASACVDLSDGLNDAVRQVANASGTGASINSGTVPVLEAAREWWLARGKDPVASAMAGGEDYELLFAVAPRRRRAFLAAAAKAGQVPVTRVGVLTAAREYVVIAGESLAPLPVGFEHFGNKSI